MAPAHRGLAGSSARRRPRSWPQKRLQRIGSLTALVVIACFVLPKLSAVAPSARDSSLPGVIRAATACLFLTAGVLRLAHWRLAAEPAAARAATILLLIGSALLCLPLIAPALQHSPALLRCAPAARVLFAVPVLLLLLTESRPSRTPRTRPMMLAGALFLGWVAANLAVGLLAPQSLSRALDTPLVWERAEWLVGLSWLALAARSSWAPASEPSSDGSWIAIARTLMGLSEVMKAGELTRAPTVFIPSLSLQLLVSAIAVGLAGRGLRQAFAAQLHWFDAVADALSDTETRLRRSESTQRERIHDARSAVAGVIGAAHLLADPRTDTDPERLRALMSAELERLQLSLVDQSEEPIVEFDVAEVLAPVLAAHQLAGGRVKADFGPPRLGPTRVLGRPLATANVVGNVLANVRSHAPRAAVELRSVRTASVVVLTLADDGPGIAAEDRARVLLPGVRGEGAGPGTGLGLHLAGQSMRAQRGALELDENPTGGTRVTLTLRAAPPSATAPTILTAQPIPTAKSISRTLASAG